MPPILAYWPMRGLSGQLRLIMHYAGEKFEDKHYSGTIDQEKDPESWPNQKFKQGLDFPNLPYYIDGDVKITQSVAIERYLARKFKLVATNEQDAIKQDNLLYVAVEMQISLLEWAYDDSPIEKKKFRLEKIPAYLKQLSAVLGEKEYFLGSKLNFVDFHLYEAISINTLLEPSCLDSFPNIGAFLARIEALPGVKEYMSSPDYVKESVTGPGASWGQVEAN